LKMKAVVVVLCSLFLTVVLLLGALSPAAALSSTLTTRRRHVLHRKTKLKTAQVEELELIKELLDFAMNARDIVEKIKHYKDQIGCRTPPVITGDYTSDALSTVYTQLAREIYDKCTMVQRINFLRSWGASAVALKVDLPSISMSDCDPLLLTIMAMTAITTTDNCDAMWKSWIYYQNGPCTASGGFKISCMANVYNQYVSYCQQQTGTLANDASCQFDTMCQNYFKQDDFLQSAGDCTMWKFNKDDPF